MRKLQEQNPNTVEYWNDKYNSKPEYEDMDQFKFENISHHISPGMTVVDIGCGNGELCKVIKKDHPSCEVIGIDYSDAVIKQLEDEEDIVFEIGMAEDTGIDEESVDFVVCCETIEHVDDPQLVIGEIYRILVPGGKFIITTPYLDHIPSDEHVWEFRYEDIERLLKQFTNSWVFPWAGGWTEVKDQWGNVHHPRGHWDTIMALGVK